MRGFFSKKNLVLMAALVFIALAAISVAGGKTFPVAKTMLTTIFKPIDNFFTDIGNAVSQTGRFIGSVMSTYEENEDLKKEIANLRKANIDAGEIWAENERLKTMLNYKQSQNRYILLPSRVVGYNPTGIEGSLIIDKGTKDGVKKDMTVVTSLGLVGSVVDAYSSASRVQLVINPKTAVGGIVQRAESRVAGIVSGNASTPFTPNLLNLARDADVKEGDTVITSGFGGIYPKGIVIGTISKVINAEGGLLKYAVIVPTVDFSKLEEVMIITNVTNYADEVLPQGKDSAGKS